MTVIRERGIQITVLCLDEYVFGEAGARRVFQEHPNINFISVGGNWNGYTPEAKQLCLSRHIGLFNSSELSGAIFRDDFWNYHKKDNKGNPSYQFRSS
ncbi:hypothetical protein RBI22_10945 [Alcaligenaceae bacterium C4P045]|nr:hypothetical protein [Alcaligenaceae bacterium C4P045]